MRPSAGVRRGLCPLTRNVRPERAWTNRRNWPPHARGNSCRPGRILKDCGYDPKLICGDFDRNSHKQIKIIALVLKLISSGHEGVWLLELFCGIQWCRRIIPDDPIADRSGRDGAWRFVATDHAHKSTEVRAQIPYR